MNFHVAFRLDGNEDAPKGNKETFCEFHNLIIVKQW